MLVSFTTEVCFLAFYPDGNMLSWFDGEIWLRALVSHLSSGHGHAIPTSPHREPTTKPSPSREADGAETFHNLN